ncbi:MAG TPA: monovalent cation/H+ antiporter complex subunit F [Acidimicrobiales bacterium]|nr:monovalent cation/H+ antiporter complex subunit F [Acidimicrobiales bacterium]
MIPVALGLISVGGAGFLYRLVRGPSLADRIVALDGLLTIIVTGVLAWSAYRRDATYLTVGVVVALVAFLGTSAFARFVEGRRR